MTVIPPAALDDRLAFTGTSGSGKTYAAGTAVEILLAENKRVGIVDPLGVWWGLRLRADGAAPSRFDVVIFGGPHGDLPLNDRAGALIGETVAAMSESWIIDLSELGTKAAERRFMLAFLDALYRKTTGEPLHVIFDEADMWAPQRLMDKEGEAAKLLGMMETFVRRGRVKGFIPWLITQRPAVLSKDVLSQADGLVAMKLTSSQDRDALGAWIEGQADRADQKAILAALPQLETGRGYVWLPGHGLLEPARFPTKVTFDSSRTPKRGEKRVSRELKPIDLGKLQERLAKVEEEVASNDPIRLKAKIRELEASIRKSTSIVVEKVVAPSVPDPALIAAAEERGYQLGLGDGVVRGWREGFHEAKSRLLDLVGQFVIEDDPQGTPAPNRATGDVDISTLVAPARPSYSHSVSTGGPSRVASSENRSAQAALNRASAAALEQVNGHFTVPQMKVLRSIAMWEALGKIAPTKPMVAMIAGYSHSSGGFGNLLGQLRARGVITYPTPGTIALATHMAALPASEAQTAFLGKLSGPQRKIVDALHHAGEMSKAELGEATGYSPTSGGFGNILGQLRTLGVVDYPTPGRVALEGWVFDLL